MGKKLVIVGAGYAGILTAKKLERKIRKAKMQDDIEITIIDRNPFHTMLSELHEVAGGRVDETSVKVSLEKVFTGRRVEVKLDYVESVDFQDQIVKGRTADYPFDFLVISAGSKPTCFGIEGVVENVFNLWSYDDAIKLRAQIETMFRSASSENDPKVRDQMLTFYVVGAGFTGVEIAGELAEFRNVLCEKFEINPLEVHINIVDMLDRTVPTLSQKQSDKATRRLQKMGVSVNLGTNVVQVGPDFIETKRNDELFHDTTSTVIWAAGIESSTITGQCALDMSAPTAGRGRIQVNEYLQTRDSEHVYVIGDNMFYIPEGQTAPVPQTVENCEQSSACCANNVFVALTGKGEMEEYQPKFHGFMVSIGSRYGIAEVGTPNKKISLASFFAMFVKHFINMVYFVQLLGWNKVFSYLKHEFFTVRNRRSFVGGHLSNRTPSFLLMPLRVWLGLVWIFEGVKKIGEGWLQTPKLSGFFSGARAWYDGIFGGGDPDGWSGATDAVTGATDVANGGGAVGEALFNLHVLFVRFQLVSGKALESSGLNDLAFRLQVPLLDSFLDKVVLPSTGFTMFFQIFIVIVEILVGLSLIGGLLTTVGSGVSLVLQLMFVMTTGLYLGTFWMVFAAIALLIAGGRTLGLDYYAMPALKKAWKRVRWAKKWYIYHD